MPSVTVVRGNLFDSSCQTLTNTVNTVGVMGAGIAKQFKARFPLMFEDYRRRCDLGQVRIGQPYLWKPRETDAKFVLNFPTKQHWRDKSQLTWIEGGLEYLLIHYREWGIGSLALPALGCSNGGLKWNQVKPVMERYLNEMDIPVEVYEPLPESDSQPRGRKRAKKVKVSPQRQLL